MGWFSPRRIAAFLGVAVIATGVVGVALAATRRGSAGPGRCHMGAAASSEDLRGPERAFAVLKDQPDVRLRIGPGQGSVCAVRALRNRYGSEYVWVESGEERARRFPHRPAGVMPTSGVLVCQQWRSPRGGGGGGCGEASQSDKSGGILTSELLVALPHKYRDTVVGIVPNGVRTVRVFNRSGTSKLVRVARNAIVVTVDGFPRYPLRAYEYRLPDGHLETGKSE